MDTIEFSKLLDQALQALETSSVCAVYGPRYIGKSTFLDQIGDKLHREKKRKVATLRLEEGSNLGSVAIQLYELLYPEAERPDEGKAILSLHEFLSDRRHILVLDEFQSVGDKRQFVDVVVRKQPKGKVILSCHQRFEVSIHGATSCAFLSHEGFQESEVEALRVKLQLSNWSKGFVDYLVQRSKHLPLVIRAVLMHLQSEPKISFSMIDEAIGRYERDLYGEFFEQISDELKLKLRELAEVKYNRKLIAKAIESLGCEVIQKLLLHGFIEKRRKGYGLRYEFVRFLKSSSVQISLEEARKWRYDESQGDDVDAIMERLQCLLEWSRKKDAALLLNNQAERLYQAGSRQALQFFCSSLEAQLSSKTVYVWSKSCREAGDIEEALSIAKRLYSRSGGGFSAFAMAGILYTLGRYSEAGEFYQEVISDEDMNPYFRFRACIDYSTQLVYEDIDKAFKTLNYADEIRRKHLVNEGQHLAAVLGAKACIYEWQGRLDEAEKSISQAIEIDAAHDLVFDLEFDRMVRSFIQFRAGRLTDLLETIDSLVLSGETLGLKYVWKLKCLKSYCLGLEGDFRAANTLFEEILQEAGTPGFGSSHSFYFHATCWSLVNGGNSDNLNQLVRKIETHLAEADMGENFEAYFNFQKLLPLIQSGSSSALWRSFDSELRFSSDRSKFVCLVSSIFHSWSNQQPELLSAVPRDLVRFLEELPSLQPYEDIDREFALALINFAKGHWAALSSRIERIKKFEGLSSSPFLFWRLNWLECCCLIQQGRWEKIDLRLEGLNSDVRFPFWESEVFHFLQAAVLLKYGYRRKVIAFLNQKGETGTSLQIALGLKKAVGDEAGGFWSWMSAHLRLTESPKAKVLESGKEFKLPSSAIDQKFYAAYKACLDLRVSKLVLSKKQVSLDAKPIVVTCLRLLMENPERFFSKEELTTLVWKEEYNPLVHDARIYSLISNLRRIFREQKMDDLIQESAGRYAFVCQSRSAVVAALGHQDSLNYRQRWIVEFAQKQSAFQRATIQRRLKVSASVAKKDLRELVDRGLIRQSGVGRAVSYQKLSS